MVSFVPEKKWMSTGLSVVRRGPDNASEVSAKWRDQKMSQFFSPEAGTSLGRLDTSTCRNGPWPTLVPNTVYAWP